MQVKEWKGDVIFMHSVQDGAADRSYGVHVAKLAGIPDNVIARANEVLDLLNSDVKSNSSARLTNDLPLFSAAPTRPQQHKASELDARLKDINPDELSAKEALDILYALKDLSQKNA
jgi:DNA mismatch repair protein MutS